MVAHTFVCEAQGCSKELKSAKEACVVLRTEDDNDEGTN